MKITEKCKFEIFCRFNRDADETIAWITEKDTLISSEYGKDLASVQTLQRKHETLERDLAALEDKGINFSWKFGWKNIWSYFDYFQLKIFLKIDFLKWYLLEKTENAL